MQEQQLDQYTERWPQGFVYFAVNEFMPDLIKVGMTQKSPYLRLDELQTTGVAGNFHLKGAFFTVDCRAAESLIHRYYSDIRVSNRREFFRVMDVEQHLFLIQCGKLLSANAMIDSSVQYFGMHDHEEARTYERIDYEKYKIEKNEFEIRINNLEKMLREKDDYIRKAIHGL